MLVDTACKLCGTLTKADSIIAKSATCGSHGEAARTPKKRIRKIRS